VFAGIPDHGVARFSRALADHARANTAGRGHGDLLRFIDPLAAAVVIDPSIVTASIVASVDVALAPGITRGMTVVDPSGRLGTPGVTIVESADIGRVTAFYAASVAHRG
jgi:purine nucleosidase/non-specific riboncleoside hydrolase